MKILLTSKASHILLFSLLKMFLLTPTQLLYNPLYHHFDLYGHGPKRSVGTRRMAQRKMNGRQWMALNLIPAKRPQFVLIGRV